MEGEGQEGEDEEEEEENEEDQSQLAYLVAQMKAHPHVQVCGGVRRLNGRIGFKKVRMIIK